MTTQELSEKARELSNALFREPRCSQRGEGPSCLGVEEERPLTRTEKAKGWARRPFYAYDPNRMCAPCACYWHAERAAQMLHELACWEARAAALAEVEDR